ncbi:MAG: phosphate acyltransferase PlsX [Oscillospiraceae bacterium]|nr:phosphate acyltransferase PlsX [Oscillospiraceae bacterium]
MKIVVDAFGGDNAPLEIIKGAAMAVAELGVQIILTGDEQIIKKRAEENNISLNNIEICHAGDIMDMHDQPNEILKSKKDSSMAVALKLVAEDKGDAFVSAGSTGAIVVGGTFIVKRLKGVKRAAIGSLVPAKNGSFLLMDVGANADCRPEMLEQFAVMASVYMKKVMNIESPTVGLLNIGTEDTKGGELQLKAYELLKEAPINFIGNVEARAIPEGACDVVITDGFTGNIVLKLYEGVSLNLFSMLKDVFLKNAATKVAYLITKSGLKQIKKKADSSEVGGAPLLGLKKPVIKAHGNSNAIAIKNAIKQAKIFAENDVVGLISKDLEKDNEE